MELAEAHRKFAKDCFNGTWDLMEKTDRTPAETEKMIAMTYASLYHWSEIGKPVNLARGHWQVSRVWTVVGEGQNALRHARLCLAVCEEHGIGDWDIAFAYEALARSYAVLGDAAERARYLALATEAGNAIVGKERDLLFNDLRTI